MKFKNSICASIPIYKKKAHTKLLAGIMPNPFKLIKCTSIEFE
nr:MAG TPA: hypothetical protein [Caudoviricetes sp.]